MVFVLLVGLSLLLYPTIADRWNAYHQSRAIIHHAENMAKFTKEECQTFRSAADDFNKSLVNNGGRWTLNSSEKKTYDSLLITDDTNIMCYVEIPKIKVSLPVYHGTSNDVLKGAIGHLEGSSLPVGGKGTHCVMSGHRGLPSAKLFTDLDKLVEGDNFMLYTLDEILTYEVDQIRVVLPSDLSTLQIDPNEDYCTLFTCTPYGINTHRLMVRGHRVDNLPGAIVITAEALQIDEKAVSLSIGIPLTVMIFMIAMVKPQRSRLSVKERLQQEV
jgi:sortase A